MLTELMIGAWLLEPVAKEIDNFCYEQDVLYDEIENLKEEIKELKTMKSGHFK